MASQWYYTKSGQRQGPVGSEKLKELAASGQLAPTDLAWKEGMTQWAEASKIKGLFPTQATVNSHEDILSTPSQQESSEPGKQPNKALADASETNQGVSTHSDSTQSSNAEPWYYLVESQRQGPVSLSALNELASKSQIQPSTQIARQGGRWIEAQHFLLAFHPEKKTAPIDDRDRWYVQRGQSFGPYTFAKLTESATRRALGLGEPIGKAGTRWITAGLLLAPISAEQYMRTEFVRCCLLGAGVGVVLSLLFGGFWSMTLVGALIGGIARVVGEAIDRPTLLSHSWGKLPGVVGVVAIVLILLTKFNVVGQPYGPKMQAFRAVVEKWETFPGEYAGAEAIAKFEKELRALIDAYDEIKFDPTKNREEAKAIIALFKEKIEGRFGGGKYQYMVERIEGMEYELKK